MHTGTTATQQWEIANLRDLIYSAQCAGYLCVVYVSLCVCMMSSRFNSLTKKKNCLYLHRFGKLEFTVRLYWSIHFDKGLKQGIFISLYQFLFLHQSHSQIDEQSTLALARSRTLYFLVCVCIGFFLRITTHTHILPWLIQISTFQIRFCVLNSTLLRLLRKSWPPKKPQFTAVSSFVLSLVVFGNLCLVAHFQNKQ